MRVSAFVCIRIYIKVGFSYLLLSNANPRISKFSPTAWHWHGNDVAMAWQWHGDEVAMTWQWHGNSIFPRPNICFSPQGGSTRTWPLLSVAARAAGGL